MKQFSEFATLVAASGGSSSLSLGVMKAKYLCLALLVVCASCNRSQPSTEGPTQLVVSPHTDANNPSGRAALAFAHALT